MTAYSNRDGILIKHPPGNEYFDEWIDLLLMLYESPLFHIFVALISCQIFPPNDLICIATALLLRWLVLAPNRASSCTSKHEAWNSRFPFLTTPFHHHQFFLTSPRTNLTPSTMRAEVKATPTSNMASLFLTLGLHTWGLPAVCKRRWNVSSPFSLHYPLLISSRVIVVVISRP